LRLRVLEEYERYDDIDNYIEEYIQVDRHDERAHRERLYFLKYFMEPYAKVI
jgi:hypothetical protein